MPGETGSRCDISPQKINSGAAPATVRKCGCLTTPLEKFREGEAAKLSSPETGQEHPYQVPREVASDVCCPPRVCPGFIQS
jgi:hypothetical protein